MYEKNYLKYSEIEKKNEDYVKNTKKCKCGHSVVIMNKSGIAECSWCHNNVFKDAKTEFEYRLKENLLKERRKLN